MVFKNQNVPVQHHVREITYKSDTFKYGAAADIFTHPRQDVIRGDVSCVKKGNQEALWTWHYDTDYGCNCNWTLKNGTKISFKIFNSSNDTNDMFSYSTNHCSPRWDQSSTVLLSSGSHIPRNHPRIRIEHRRRWLLHEHSNASGRTELYKQSQLQS